jgi:hypothetical protein
LFPLQLIFTIPLVLLLLNYPLYKAIAIPSQYITTSRARTRCRKRLPLGRRARQVSAWDPDPRAKVFVLTCACRTLNGCQSMVNWNTHTCTELFVKDCNARLQVDISCCLDAPAFANAYKVSTLATFLEEFAESARHGTLLVVAT